LWANISNAALLETARELLDWHEGISPGSLFERFSLREITAGYGSQAEYTGYFTPVLDVRAYPDSEYRIPIYKKPPGSLALLSHAEIAQHALSGQNLEIAWTNDPLNLYFAQVQGSGIAHFPDGHNMTLSYASDNGKSFHSIADYMKQQGYKPRNYGNEGIREWLRNHPDKLGEVLTYNPRYIFFKLTNTAPQTASGNGVIPGHTVAVDKRYIPLGSVLLAEVPRIDGSGREVGSDWRLLFAQDQGKNITGQGRFDLYTGSGVGAENIAHGITGFRKTYMLIRKDGLGRNAHIAGL
jgi:membrane-bound lytic murein transglycosylase A